MKTADQDWSAFNTDVVVERRGFGREPWHWRVAHNGHTIEVSEHGYRCAEDAYTAGQACLKRLQASPPSRPQITVATGELKSTGAVLPMKAKAIRRPYRSRLFPARAATATN